MADEENPPVRDVEVVERPAAAAPRRDVAPDPPILAELDLPMATTPSARVASPLVVISKKSRPSDLDKRTTLFEQITKNQHDKYKLMSTSLKSIDDLSETYGLQVLLKNTASIFTKYDLTDVFVIVFPVKNADGTMTQNLEQRNGGIRKVDLLYDYLAVTPTEVAESTMWYVTWTDHERAPWISENLSLSYDFFQNHVDDMLWGKLLEDMEPYSGTAALGGPLIFVLMMRRLQANSQLVITTIHNKIKVLRIDQYAGENVSDLVSHLRALIGRLRTLERRDENNRVITPVMPTDINKALLQIFQTSSDSKFNGIFANKELVAYESALTMGDAAYGNPETLMTLANALYSDMVAGENGWTGADHKASAGAFVAGTGGHEADCFNCGWKHLVDACPQPKNEERIAENKKKFWNAKKARRESRRGNGNGNGRGNGHGNGNGNGNKIQWPAAPTDRKKNRRKISGKYYYYHFQDRRWKLCDNQSDGANKPHLAANVAAPPKSPADETKAEDQNKVDASKAQKAASSFIAAIQKNVDELANGLKQE